MLGGTEGGRSPTGVPPTTVAAAERGADGQSIPDAAVPEKPVRRRFTAEYKLRILQEADRCVEPGQLGALLRREGLYSSHVISGRRQRAWGTFCKEYSGGLLEFVQLGFGCGREKSEEIVQMTFVRCVRSIGTFDPARGPLLPWLKVVARNGARSCLRSERRGGADCPLSALPKHVLDRLADAIDRTPLPDELYSPGRRCLAASGGRDLQGDR